MAAIKPTPGVIHTLLSLAEGPRHGYAILDEVEVRGRGAVRLGPSSLYYTLGRLQDAGLIDEVAEPDEPAADDEPHAGQRRYYALTTAGRSWLERELEQLRSLMDHARGLGLEVGG